MLNIGFAYVSGANVSLVAINTSTGEITIQSIVDYESLSNPGSLDITVRVTDSGGNTATHPLNLAVDDVNDNSPVFSQTVHSVTVTENNTGGNVRCVTR